jgi:glycosyltransferase involved in cell wall biosynthesis
LTDTVAPIKATVVIPTYNGARRVTRVLEALASQRIANGTFEIVVVDNNSDEDVAGIIVGDPAWPRLCACAIECRIISEPRPGVLHARIRGVRTARSDIICFLDDDNIPDADYLAIGISAFDEQKVGMLISAVRAKYEAAPPPSVARRQHLFAVNEALGGMRIDFGASGKIAPTITAGMWVRRSVFLSSVPWEQPERLMTGRVGEQLISGEDIEFGVLVGRAGYHRIYLPNLRLKHEIPRSRLRLRYLRRLAIGVVRSECTLRVRYEGAPHGFWTRAAAVWRLVCALVAFPYLALSRRDPFREIVLVMADRWARIRGPYSHYLRA